MGLGFGPPPGAAFKRPKLEVPKTPRAFLRFVKKQINDFCFRLFYIFRLIWETSPSIVAVMTVFCVLNGVLPVVSAIISSELINSLVNALSAATGNSSLAEFFNSDIIFLLTLQLLFLFFSKLSSLANNMVTKLAGERITNHIKVKIIDKAKEIDTASFDDPAFYERLENANREAGHRPMQILSSTFSIISTVISMISFIVIVAAISPFAPLAVVLLAIPSAIVNFVYRKKIFLYVRRSSKERREMNYCSEILVDKDSAKEIKLLGLHRYFKDKYDRVFKIYFEGLKKLIVRENLWQMLVSTVHILMNVVLFGYVAFKVFAGELQLGDYTLYTGALNSISSYVTALITTSATVYEGTLFIDNMIIFMNEKKKIVPRIAEPFEPERHIAHTVEFRNVTFYYPGASTPALKNISFSLKGDETAVLVGLNGAGKTTLVKLLTRLYDPTEGEILLDGKDLRDYDVEKLYDIFGIVFQDFGRYAVTVAENIAFGDISKPMNMDKVRAAAESGNAAQFIERLPEKYETPLMRFLEDNGTELSTGQWQKLSISRGFYKDCDILILDEPTASLDALAEQDVFDQFDKMRKGKITLFVSHRLSSATNASKIIVIDHGELVECGTHDELMKLRGKYEHLFSTQARRYIENAEIKRPSM